LYVTINQQYYIEQGNNMSSKTDQLIAKALSTTSEDEAIACLRMARKHNTGGTTTQVANSNNTDWEEAARKYHKLAYKLQEDLKLANIQLRFYVDASIRHELDAKFAKRKAEIVSNDMKNRMVYGVVVLVLTVCVSFSIGHAIL
jgi:hypothetical protein